MKFVKGAISATAIASALIYGERIADPLGRHGPDYTLEASTSYSEVPVYSTNWYDAEGKKHDDRLGDALLCFTALAGATRVIVAIGEFESANKKIPIARDRSVT